MVSIILEEPLGYATERESTMDVGPYSLVPSESSKNVWCEFFFTKNASFYSTYCPDGKSLL